MSELNLSANQWKDEMTRFQWTPETGTPTPVIIFTTLALNKPKVNLEHVSNTQGCMCVENI